tara:strand:- start:494 stop:835 length:342 start_codon:yes stop_codon:yes gene_type:complete
MSGEIQSIDRVAAPTAQIGLGLKTAANDAWDNGDSLDITVGSTITPEFLHVTCVDETWLICNAASATYAGTLPAYYFGGQTHIIPCRGMTHLHFKSADGDDQAIYATVFGNLV